MPTDPKELMLLAAKTSNLTGEGIKPWHLKASYTLYDENGNVKDQGSFEEFWAAPDKYKLTTTGQKFVQTDFGTKDGVRRSGQQEFVPTMLSDALREIDAPLPAMDMIAHTMFTVQSKESGNSVLTCLRPEGPWYGLPLVYCLAGNPPVPRVIVYSATGLQTIRNRMIRFDGHIVPGDIAFKESGKTLLAVHVENLESIDSPSDTVFAPIADAIALYTRVPISGGVATGMLIEKVVPEYPAAAKAAHISGTVVLQAQIEADGRVSYLQVISGPPVLHKAALDAVKKWRYRPYLMGGKPIAVATTINIIFNLGEPPSGLPSLSPSGPQFPPGTQFPH
jgi:TonB family protein